VSKGIAILGSCFGHQLVALAISGAKVVRRAKKPEIGWVEIKIKNSNDIFKGMDNKIFAFNSHFDEVFDLPKEYRVLAFSSNCSVQAFQYLDKPVWGIQFHPEIDIYQARIFLKKGEIYLSEHAHLFKKALNSNPQDSKITSIILKNFIFFS
jgi:GMP synthase-like glutamine amidotransferase